MNHFKHRIPVCMLFLAAVLSILAAVPARAERVIPVPDDPEVHYWDDGLSDWMAFRFPIATLSQSHDQPYDLSAPSTYCVYSLKLSEFGIKAGDILSFSAEVAFYPLFQDSAKILIDFRPGHEETENIIYSTLETGTAYAEVSMTVPEGAEEVFFWVTMAWGDFEHFYYRNRKLTVSEGTGNGGTPQNGIVSQDNPSEGTGNGGTPQNGNITQDNPQPDQNPTPGSTRNFIYSSHYVAYNGHWYQLFREKATWEEVIAFCGNSFPHVHPVTINSAEEQAFIEHFLRYNINVDSSFNGRYIIGLDKDTGAWITGEPLAYTNWGEGEPDNYGGSQPIVVLTTEELSGSGFHVEPFQWDDEEEGEYYFIIEWDNGEDDGNLCKWRNDMHYWDPEKDGWESVGRLSLADSEGEVDGYGSFCTGIYLGEFQPGRQLKFSGTFYYAPEGNSPDPVHILINFRDTVRGSVTEPREILVTPTEGSYYEEIFTIPENMDYVLLNYTSLARNLRHFCWRDLRLEFVGDSESSQTDNSSTGKELSSENGEWIPADNAYLNHQGWYILTENKTWQSGTLQRAEPLQSENFTVDFDFYTGDHDGADGIWFVFYSDWNEVSKPDGGIVNAGGGYAVELDTYHNSAFGDPGSNHVALIQEDTSNHLCSADASGFTEDGAVHHMRVEVQNEVCTVYVDGLRLLNQGGIKPTGFYDMFIIGTTGGSSNLQAVINISLEAEPLLDSGTEEQPDPGDTSNVEPEDTGVTDPGNTGNVEPEDTDVTDPGNTGNVEPEDTGVTDPGNSDRVDREDGSYTENGYYYFTDRNGTQVYAPINSFASYVVDYKIGDPWTTYEDCQDPQKTLGLPDDNDETGAQGEYNLGAHGTIVLGFSRGICDGPGDDIYVFEVGGDVEDTKVEVSNDLENWYDVGVAEGRTAGVDISGKVPEGQVFQYVRLTDLRGSISSWPGADIDAVCGLNTQRIPKDQLQDGVTVTVRTVWNGHNYQVFEGSMTWAQARDYCISLGGHLATVSGTEENNFLKTLTESSAKKLFWIGGTDAAQEGTWTWITGEGWGFSDWSSGEPDNRSGADGTAQNCLLLDLERNGWDDLGNEGDSSGNWMLKNIGFICEWE